MTTVLALATTRHQARRLIATGTAVTVGVAFLAAALVLGVSLRDSIITVLTGDLSRYAVVVTAASSPLTSAQRAVVEQVPGVTNVSPTRNVEVTAAGRPALLTTPPTAFSPARASTGRMPRANDEVAVSLGLAARAHLDVGDPLTVTASDAATPPDHGSSGIGGPTTKAPTVVGVIDAARDAHYPPGLAVVFATDGGVVALAGDRGYDRLQVIGEGDGLLDAVTAAVHGTRDPAGLASGTGAPVVQTGAQAAQHLADRFGESSTLLLGFVLALCGVALLVCAVVIANTFTILLAHRTRQTALLRCVGATRGQVVGTLLGEAAVVGAVCGVLGAVVGTLTAFGLLTVTDRVGTLGVAISPTISPAAVAGAALAGLALTIGASMPPVIRASATGPLQGLHPPTEGAHQGRVRPWRVVVGVVLLVVGGALLAGGASLGTLLLGFPGGVLTGGGVLVLMPALVSLLTRLAGTVWARPAGVAGELAVENAARNPRRAAATATALFIGVALVTTTVVGGLTTQRTISALTAKEYPVDLAVVSNSASLPASAEAQLATTPGISGTAPVVSAQVQFGSQGSRTIVGIPDDLSPVTADPMTFPAQGPGKLILGSPEVEPTLPVGSRVVVSGDRGEQTLVVIVDKRLGYARAVAQSDLSAIASPSGLSSVLLRVAPQAHLDQVIGEVSAVMESWPDCTLGGAGPHAAQLDSEMSIVLRVTVGLLAVAILIALIGVGNTLSLSVHERRRESALLRALGVTRGQLRAMLALEGVLLAGVGSLVGVVAGVAFGIAGVASLLGERAPVVPGVPWGVVGSIMAVAVLAGLLASVLPARTAARVQPALALADE